ncbi:nucleotidyl transferase AbiEii/AbiGii toxin family protein [Kushneria sp. EE4]
MDSQRTVQDWVKDESLGINPDFKKVVHTVLLAISNDSDLSESMVMKGGVLMGISYRSERFTTDIDFSTKSKISSMSEKELRERLDRSLEAVIPDLMYEIKAKVQSIEVKPRMESTFPSYKIKIGYASQRQASVLRQLERGQSPKTLSIDYSFNEETGSVQELTIDGDEDDSIKVYSLVSMIAEKIRSILQQVVRDRSRRQDIYDLYLLVSNYATKNKVEMQEVLETLFAKSEGKGIEEFLNQQGISDPRVVEASRKDYLDMSDEISGELPDFDEAYEVIRLYFEDLPWQSLNR